MIRIFNALAIAALFILCGCRNSAEAGFESSRISVTTSGEGRDVVLIHGLMAGPQVWSRVLQPEFKYHLVQIKGFGGTPADGNRADPVVAGSAAEIARYIRSGKLKDPIIVGHSMGGAIGLLIAAQHPGAAAKLMVVDEPPFVGGLVAPGARPSAISAVAARMAQQVGDPNHATRARFIKSFMANMTFDSKAEQLLYQLAMRSDREVTARAFRELILMDLTPELAKIRVPTRVLYVKPKGIPISEDQIAKFYAGAYAPLKGAQLSKVPASAHYVMLDNPTRFRAELKTFAAR